MAGGECVLLATMLRVAFSGRVWERVRNETQHAGIDNFPSWTPDGRLTFVSNRDGGFEIYVAKAAAAK